MSPSYYVAQGKQAYTTVSEMDSPRPSAALFRKLAAHFEICVCALNVEKDFLRDAFYQYLMRQLCRLRRGLTPMRLSVATHSI